MAWQGQPGPEDAVGGISGVVQLDTSQIDPGLAALRTGLDRAGADITRLEAKMGSATRWTDRWMVGLGGVGAEANRSGYRLQVFAQGLDDLQYVGEMGLRPILNNIIQISPALGIAALGVQQVVSAMGGLEGINKTLFGQSKTLTEAEQMDSLAKNTHKTAEAQKLLNQYKKEQQQIEAMLSGESKAEKATAGAVQGVFDETDAEAIVQGIMAKRAAEGAPLEHDKHLPGAIEKKVDRLHVAQRVARGVGTPAEMASFGIGGPQREAEKLQTELNDLARKLIAARRRDAEREMLAAKKDPKALIADMEQHPELFPAGEGERLEAARVANRNAALIAAAKRGIEGRKELVEEEYRQAEAARPPGARLEDFYKQGLAAKAVEDAKAKDGAADEATAAAFGRVKALQDVNKAREDRNEEALGRLRDEERDAEARDRLTERGGDLNYRLRQLVNPQRQGQSMSLDQYEASIKSQTGDSPEVKRLHAIHEVLKDIKRNNEKLKLIGVKRR